MPLHRARWTRPTDDGRIECVLCPRLCTLSDGQAGFCFIRKNEGGALVNLGYGRSTGFWVDPIEKKPLNHFLPGTPVLTFGTAGCNLGCKFCQNWDISKAHLDDKESYEVTPQQVVDLAVREGCPSIAFSYNDPTIWAEFAVDVAQEAHARGVKTVFVTAGYITPEARPDVYAHMDAANVDLKGFTEEFYRKVTLSHLEPVLETLVWLKREGKTWFEITTLLIPGLNDSEREIRAECEWILKELGPDVPLHFTAFHPDFKMLDRPSTPPETLARARDLARSMGVRYCYVGNVHDKGGQTTYCSGCAEKLIERDWYRIGPYRLEGERCARCGTKVPGVFAADGLGAWRGGRRPAIPRVRA